MKIPIQTQNISCTTCSLQYKQSNEINLLLTNGHVAASNEYNCHIGKVRINLKKKEAHSYSKEQKIEKGTGFCEACQKDINMNDRQFHFETIELGKKKFNFRIKHE